MRISPFFQEESDVYGQTRMGTVTFHFKGACWANRDGALLRNARLDSGNHCARAVLSAHVGRHLARA